MSERYVIEVLLEHSRRWVEVPKKFDDLGAAEGWLPQCRGLIGAAGARIVRESTNPTPR